MESKENIKRFDYKEMACFRGHITVDAFNCVCGYKYKYNGILSSRERLRSPRDKNNYLRYVPLKDVGCGECKRIMYDKLNKEHKLNK